MLTRWKTLTAADGHPFDARIGPEGGATAGAGSSRSSSASPTTRRAGRSAPAFLGCAVAIPAKFDRRNPGAVIAFDQFAEGRALMLAAKLDQTMMDIDATRAALAAQGGKVGMIGFCWGGGLVFRAAQVLDVACAVSFYGTRLKDYLDRPLKAPVQGHFGKTDDHTPPELVAETQGFLGDAFEVFTYDAGHAFANDARPAYVAQAAEAAHARAEAFLAAHID